MSNVSIQYLLQLIHLSTYNIQALYAALYVLKTITLGGRRAIETSEGRRTTLIIDDIQALRPTEMIYRPRTK